MRFHIVCISELKGHEFPEQSRVDELERDLRKRGTLLKPIVADRGTKVILDGHCRCDALRRLGCSKVAVRFVDYSSGEIEVRRWSGGEITKEEVLEAGMRGILMKPKTSKHMIIRDGRRLHISRICRNEHIPLAKLS
ncbi:ParB N-terminal domain-containing protein [Candidatus Micrarchaeota archaeon]|nr:ParB N-terminal domain-containing protein [Candidatus Micrarchaeota archaeon]